MFSQFFFLYIFLFSFRLIIIFDMTTTQLYGSIQNRFKDCLVFYFIFV